MRLLVLLLSLLCTAPAHAAEWRIISQQEHGIPPYISYTPVYSFGPGGLGVDAVRAELFSPATVGCPTGLTVYTLNLDFEGRGANTAFFPDGQGIVWAPGRRVYSAQVYLNNPYSAAYRCIIRVSALATEGGGGDDDGGSDDSGDGSDDSGDGGDDGDPVPDHEWEMAGVIPYRGGFRFQELVRTETSYRVKFFFLRVPPHCETSLEIIDPGTITEGHLDPATATSEANVWQVGGEGGNRVSAISVSLNGPGELFCDIPVYIEKAP